MKSINAQDFKEMIICAANNLYNNHKYVDSLNVFPVPDGDTGTNMNLTMMSGIKEISDLKTNNASEIAKAFSRGLLMGARGNSGVILSQIFKGMAVSMESNRDIDAQLLSESFKSAKETAYKSVLNPVEGTILTVIKDVSNSLDQYIAENANVTIEETLAFALEEAKKSLNETPKLLPALKDAGVVDSGGAGLVYIMEGLYASIKGESIPRIESSSEVVAAQTAVDSSEEGFGYCTEFILRLDESKKMFNEIFVKETLSNMGNSIVLVRDEDILKVHIHTLTPGDVLNFGQQYGEFIKLKIENMQEQHNEIIASKAESKKKYGLIAVGAGKGMEQIFKDIRVDYMVKGGNTMNPSTQDFVEAFKKVNAEHIFVLPNNSNILLAAKQAASVYKDAKVHVIETKTVPQGVLACMLFNPEEDVDTNFTEMSEARNSVKTGQLTNAVRNSSTDGFKIQEGDYIGVSEKRIVSVAKSRVDSACKMLDSMIDEDDYLVTIYVGEGANKEDTDQIVEYLEEKYSIDIEVAQADQPVYYYIFAVE